MILPHTDGDRWPRASPSGSAARSKEFVFLEDEHPTRITVSAGVATYPSAPDIDSVDALVRAADRRSTGPRTAAGTVSSGTIPRHAPSPADSGAGGARPTRAPARSPTRTPPAGGPPHDT